MIAYFDSSAAVPLLIEDEPGVDVCRRVWQAADAVVTTRLLYVETAAALARAERMGRLTPAARDAAMQGLEDIWSQFDVIEVADLIVRRAAVLAFEQGLRGYDAVHCAAGLTLAGAETVALTGDRALLAAWRANGVDVVDTGIDGRDSPDPRPAGGP